MKVRGLAAVFYSVKDVPRAIEFYKGFIDVADTTFENEHGVEWILRDGNAFGVGKYSSGEWAPSGCVLFDVENADATAKRVEELGGKLTDAVREFPGCRAQWCEDPDGNVFVIHQTKPKAV
jgi:predicted enzyme related to lactoylglutathione lyase